MSVALALVGPVLARREPDAGERFSNLISDSRRTATRRAQAMELDVRADGDWTLSTGYRGENAEVVKYGRLLIPSGPVRIRISPLGICVSSGSATRVDPLTCMAPSRPVQ